MESGRRVRGVWIAVVLGTCMVGVQGVVAANPDSLHLDEVLAWVVMTSRPVKASEAAVLYARAEAVRAAEFLDPSVQLVAEAARLSTPGLVAPVDVPWVRTYRASILKGTSWGVSFGPYVEHATHGVSGHAASSRLGLTLTAPLLRLGNQHPVAQAMEASALAVHAAYDQKRHVLAQELFQAALAYTELHAEQARLHILKDAATRAQEVQRIVSRLVEAGERAASDEIQAEAFAADRDRETRVAEQQVWERLGRLATLTGVSVAALEGRPLAARREKVAAPELDERVVESALAGRPDLAAVTRRLEAARLERRAHGTDLKPHLQLVGSIGQELGSGRTMDASAGFASVRLQLSGSAFRRSARAALWMQLARERELEAHAAQLRVEARAALEVVHAAVRHAMDELRSARRAHSAHERAVASERAKLEAGFATVYDVILVEDRLTNARLSAQTAHTRLTQALARLAYESGSIVRNEHDTARTWSERMQRGGAAWSDEE